METQSINIRLKNYKDKTGKSVARIALESELSQDNLYKWIKGTKISNVEDYKKLETFLSKNSDNKIGKPYPKIEGDEKIKANEPVQGNYLQKRLDKKNSDIKTLEYYEIGANASLRTNAEISPISKPAGKLHLNELFKGSQYAIRVSGNSMTPNYPSGCIIGIRLIEDFMINPGSVYVIETGNDLWIKRLYYLNNDRSTETIVLMSDNKMKEESGERQGQYCYPSFTLHKSEIKNIFRVTGVFKSNILTLIDH